MDAVIVSRECWVTVKMAWWTVPAIEGFIMLLLATIGVLSWKLLQAERQKAR